MSVEPIIEYSSYTGNNLSVNTTSSRASDFSSGGSRFYILGRHSTSVSEYHLSSDWNIETASYVRSFDFSSDIGGSSVAHGLYFRKSDGKKMWILNRTEIYEFTLSTAWDVSSAVQTGYKDLDNYLLRGHDIDFKPDGDVLYVDDRVFEGIFQFNLSSSWDVETATLDYVYDISGQQNAVRGTQFSPDGNRLFLMDTGQQEVLEYYVSNSFNLRSASYIGSYDVGSQSGNPRGLTFKPDLSMFYVTENDDEIIYQYRIATVDPDESTMEISKEKVVANDDATSRITVTARDQNGNRIGGRRVNLSSNSSNATIDAVNSTTNSNGEARFNVSNSVAENVTFTASSGGETINDTEVVRFVTVDARESSVASSQQKVHANGVASSTITVIARDEDGDELQDVDISLIPDGGSSQVKAVQATTDSNGLAEFRVTNTVAEMVSYRGRGGGVTIDESVSVNFIPIDADESEISISREKVLANGSAEAIITVIARDEDGQEFRNVDINLRQGDGNSEITKVQETTDSEGVAIFRVKNSDTGEITYSASALGVTISQTVTAKFVTVDTDESIISANPENVQANGEEESRITVTTRDEDGDELAGARIVLEDLNGSSQIDDPEKTTNLDGEAVFTVSNETPQVVNYKITAEGIEFPDHISIGFIPIAPVALSASDVQTREFQANWEMVNGADSYLIDISTDSSFSNLVDPYDEFDTGNGTHFTVDNVAPGTTYLYRVKVMSDGLIGANSQIIQTTTFPDTPEATAASERNALEFTANWNESAGARKYKLDVSTDESFNTILTDYNNLDVGTETTFTVTNLIPGQSYYYRVRSEAGPRVSDNSNIIDTSTLTISSEQSEITSEQLKVLANGDQGNELKITVKSDEGVLLEGLQVILNQTEGNSEIRPEPEQPVATDEEGVAIFEVTSASAGISTYTVSAAGIEIGEISVEFLQDDGVLRLGNNFPNPFMINSIIPVTIPRSMNVELVVYNSLGVPVRTLKDENMDEGYFEIPFNGADLAAGVYFYRLITEDGTKTGKMVLVK